MDIDGFVRVKVGLDLDQLEKDLQQVTNRLQTFDKNATLKVGSTGLKETAANAEVAGSKLAAAAQRVAAANNTIAGAAKAAATGQDSLTRSTNAAADAVRKYNTTTQDHLRLTNALSAALNTLNQSEKAATDQAAAMTQWLRAATQAEVGLAAAKDRGNAQTTKAAAITKQQANELKNLSFQLNDVVSGLAMGQRPQQIFVQQSGQIIQNTQGLSVVFRAVLSPLGLVISGIAAVAGAMAIVVARAITLSDQLRQFRLILALTGNAAGTSAEDMQKLVEEVSKLPRATREGTEQAAQAMLRNPLLSGEIIRKLLPMVANFAAAMGQDVPQATETLINAITGGEQAARRMLQTFDLFTAAEVKLIGEMERSGNTAGAMRVALDALSRTNDRLAKEGVTPLAEAMKDLGNAWNSTLNALARSRVVIELVNALKDLLDTLRKILELDLGAILRVLAFMNPGTAGAATFFGSTPTGDDPRSIEQAPFFQKLALATKAYAQANADFAKAQAERDRLLKTDPTTVNKHGEMLAEAEGAMAQAKARAAELNKEISDINAKLKEIWDRGPAAGQQPTLLPTVTVKPGLDQKGIDEAIQKLNTINDIEARRAAIQQQIAQQQALIKTEGLDPMIYERAKIAVQRLQGAYATAETEQEKWLRTQKNEQEVLRASPQMQEAVRAKQEAQWHWLGLTGDASIAAAKAQERYNLVLQQGGQAAARELAALSETAKANLKVAETYIKAGDAAALYQDEVTKARIAEAKGQNLGTSPEEFARKTLEERATAGVKDIAAQTTELNRQAESIDRVSDATRKSSTAGEEAQRQEQAFTAILKLRTIAMAAGNVELAKAIDEFLPKYKAALDRVADAQLRQQAIAANKQNDPQAAFRDELERIEKLRKTNELTVRAEVAMREEAYIKMGRASDSFIDGAIAGLMEWGRTARNVGDQVANAITQALNATVDLIARMMLGMKVNFKSLITDLKLALMRAFAGQALSIPISFVMQALGVGGGGIFGGGSTTISGQPTTIGSPGIFGNMFGGGMFGGTGGGGSIFGLDFSSPLFGPFAGMSPSSFEGVIPGMSGSNALNYFAGLSGAPTLSLGGLLSGLGSIGMGVAGLASGNTIGGGAGILGGGLSLLSGLGAIGPAFGPIGTVIGLVGGLLGGLFKKKVAAPQGVSNLAFGANGWESSIAMSRGKGGLGGVANKATGALGDALDQLTGAYGLEFMPGSIGGYLINSIGKKTGNIWQGGLGTYGGARGMGKGAEPIEGVFGSAEEAANVIAAAIFKRNASSGLVSGLSATQQRAISFADLKSLDDIKAALDFSKVYDKYARGKVNIAAATAAFESLDEEFKQVKAGAKEYGLDLAIITQRYNEAKNQIAIDFNKSARSSLLGFTDTDMQQREALAESQAARLREAQAINDAVPGLVDFAQLASLSAKELQALEYNLTQARTELARSTQDFVNLGTTTSAEQSMRAITDTFEQLSQQTLSLGMSITSLQVAYDAQRRLVATNFNDAISQALLQLTNPDQASRNALTRAQEARQKEAEYLNNLFPGLIDFADLVALNNAELKALEETLGHANDSIQAALDKLRFGGESSAYSVAQQYTNALGEFSTLRDAAYGGTTYDKDRLISVSDQLLDLAKRRFSTGSTFADIAKQIEDLYEYILNRPGYATGVTGAHGWAWVGGGPDNELVNFGAGGGTVLSPQSSNDFVKDISELVGINEGQANLLAELVKEIRMLRREVAELKREQVNRNSTERAAGVLKVGA